MEKKECTETMKTTGYMDFSCLYLIWDSNFSENKKYWMQWKQKIFFHLSGSRS